MRLEDESSLARLIVVVALLAGASTASAAEVELTNLTAKELKSLERRAVTLHLASGRDLEGNVVSVSDRIITLERARALTYVELSRIEAVTVAPRVAPSRAELDALAKTLAPVVPIQIEWKSVPDDGGSRILVSHAIEDVAAALRATASDADGKAALAKIAHLSFALAPASTAAIEKSVLVLRYDPKNAPDVRALQSLIENKL